MTLQITEGRYYRTRDGRKVGPMEWRDHGMYPWAVPLTSTRAGMKDSYHGNGRYLCGTDSPQDIVAEWSDTEPSDSPSLGYGGSVEAGGEGSGYTGSSDVVMTASAAENGKLHITHPPRSVTVDIRRPAQAAIADPYDCVGAAEASAPDPVNHPPHYTFGRFEVIDVLQDWFPANPLLWQVGKYIARAHRKGATVEDLRKAKFYLEREIDRVKAIDAAAEQAVTEAV